MKKLLLLFLLFFYSIFSYSQNNSDTTEQNKKNLEYYIEYCKDLMTDKEYAFGSKILMCSDDGKKGFSIRISWNYKKGKISYSGITVRSVGIGSCNEKDELIFLFEDDSKYTLKAWNDFNCEGKSYFDLYYKYFDEFNNKKIKAIRFTNGRSYDSYTYKPTQKEQEYFIEAKRALDNKMFVSTSCD
jgi:hypothetical protein